MSTVNIENADEYIALNCIDTEDWTDADEAKKQRILNVAGRTLSVKYPDYTIPDAAVYEFANVLCVIFNDTNRYSKHGIASFGVSGVANFAFKAELVFGPDVDLSKFIPQSALDIIGEENDVTLAKRAPLWTVM